MFRRLAIAVVTILAASQTAGAAPRDGLVTIGTATINPYETGANVDVRKASGAFRAIRLETIGQGAAKVTRVQIFYSDGTSYSHDKNFTLYENERTRELDPSRSDRFIDRVIISTQPSSDRTVVDIVGSQTRAGARMKRPAPASGDLSSSETDGRPRRAEPGAIVDGNDVMFGYQNVGFGLDRDVIKVGGQVGKFDRIRLRVLGNTIHILTLKMIYADGDAQELAVDADIKANRKTDWFEIDGSRFIREIQMLYRSKPSLKGQARVEVTGQYAKGWLGPEGEGRKYNSGWVVLGAQTAGFTGFDRDTITVGRNEGGFSRLRIMARERAITLREVRVKFFEGPDQVFKMNERIDADKYYGPLEFKGGKAAIKEIEAKYRSRFDILRGLKTALDTTPAVVEFWGQH